MRMAQSEMPKKSIKNSGQAAAIGSWTRQPAANDLGCQGALPVRCQAGSRFRTISGMCNNLEHPLWGSASSKQARFLPPSYADGKSEPRGSLYHSYPASAHPIDMCPRCFTDPRAPLPNPRLVSLNFHRQEFKDDSRRHQLTNMFVHFGQFLDHDFVLSPQTRINGSCCDEANFDNKNCFPMSVPRDDPIFNRTCMDFPRTVRFCNDSHVVAEQVNANTAFIDASMVYGSSPDPSLRLRELRGGRLKSFIDDDGKELLPFSDATNSSDAAGDVRVLENPALTGLHVIFLREHNRMAEEISKLRPKWSDEEVYQFARLVIGAQLQNVAFGQFLPILLGHSTCKDFKLLPDHINDKYDPEMDPSVRNSFSTAALGSAIRWC